MDTIVLEEQEKKSLEEGKRLPFGFLFAEPITTPEGEITDPRLLAIYASTTWSTSTPEGPDNPTEDTER